MLRGDFRLPVLDNDHWSTNSAAVTGNVDRVVVVIDVHAHKFTESPCSPQLPEVCDKASGITREANDSPVHVYHE
jgi:hypothetical protein